MFERLRRLFGRSDAQFAGTVDGTDAYIGIVAGPDAAVGFICDGDAIAHWMAGPVNRSKLALFAGDGSAVTADMSGDQLDGIAFLPASSGDPDAPGFTLTGHPLRATRARGDAGLFREDREIDGTRYVAGWIRLEDGSVRRNVTSDPASATEATTRAPAAVPHESQSAFPPRPRSALKVTTAPTPSPACANATREADEALRKWAQTGSREPSPIKDRYLNAQLAAFRACGGTTLYPW